MEDQNPVEIVLGVPGRWLNRAEIVTSIAKKSRGYLFQGDTIFNESTQESFELDIAHHDPDLAEAFIVAGHGQFSRQEITALATHTYTVYAIGPGGSFDAAREIMNVAAALLRSGGIALRVESSGAVHSAEQWLNCVRYKDNDLTALYDAYVVVTRRDDLVYSCGMHNLGFRDGIISMKNPSEETVNELQAFLLYLLGEKPELKDGTIFSTSAKTPHYRLKGEKCTAYSPGDLLYNPYGMWRLTKI